MTPSPMRQSCATCALARKTQRAPTIVSEPPPAVPGFIVTPSRIKTVLADRQANRLAAIFEVLRLVADRGEREDASCARRSSFRRRRSHARSADAVARASLQARRGKTARSARPPRAARRSRRRRSDGCWPCRRHLIHRTSIAELRLRRRGRHRPSLRRGTTTCCGAWRYGSCETAPDRRERRACGTSPCRSSSGRRRSARR